MELVGRPFEKTVSDVINSLDSISELWVAIAYLSRGGLSLLKSLIARVDRVRLVLCLDPRITDYEAVDEVVEINSVDCRCYKPGEDRYFHPKVYIFKHFDRSYSILLGSSNLTKAGCIDNIEANIFLHKIDFIVAEQFIKYFNIVFENGRILRSGGKVLKYFKEEWERCIENRKEWQLKQEEFQIDRKKILICKKCGKEFFCQITISSHRKYCDDCKAVYDREWHKEHYVSVRKDKPIKLVCKGCGNDFQVPAERRGKGRFLYCSDECKERERKRKWDNRRRKVCPACNREFVDNSKFNCRKYCSNCSEGDKRKYSRAKKSTLAGKCKYCLKELNIPDHLRGKGHYQFCLENPSCKENYYKEQKEKKRHKICKACGKEFKDMSKQNCKRYCDRQDCKSFRLGKKKYNSRICDYCGEKFIPRQDNQKYCGKPRNCGLIVSRWKKKNEKFIKLLT